YFFAQSWLCLLPGVLLLSVIGLAEPAVEAIKADSVKPEERGRGYAMMSTLPRIPAMIAPAIGGIIIADGASDLGINLSGMRMAYIMLFGGVIAAGLIRLIFLKDIFRPGEEGSGLGMNVFRDVYETIITSPHAVKRLLMLSGFFMFCFHLDASVRSVYAIDVRDLSTVEWGLIVSTTLVLSSFTTFITGWIVDRYGRKMVFVPSIMLLAIGSLVFAVSNNFPTFLLSRIIGSVGLYGRMVSFQVLIADSIPVSIRGRIMGVFNIFHSMGSSTAIMVSGLLYDVAPVLPFYTSALALVFASLMAVKFVHEPAHAQI
ncbi:MAG: MFS transporter, partial [Candidatus Bathyarchaeota archaeon]